VVPSPTAAPPAGAFPPRGVSHAVSGAVGGAGQPDRYAFRAERGQLLEARLKRAPGGGLYGALALVAPSGAQERCVSPNDRGEAFLEVRELASSGAYALAVSGVGGTTGPYTLTWTLDRFGRLVDGAAVDAEIGESGQWDRYRIEARQGQRLEARVRRASGVGFYGTLSLVDSAGAEEQGGTPNDQGGAFLRVQRLASSGTYTLVVSGVGGAVGPYTVSLLLR